MSNITDAELDRLHHENLVMSVQVERQLKLIEGLKPLARLGIEAIEASQQGSLLYNPNLQDMGILIKLLIIAVVSFPLIMILYELFVRRFNIVRFFFGMRPKKKPSATPAPRPEAAAA